MFVRMNNTNRPVLVGTERTSLWFGYLVGEPTRERVELERARMIAFWPEKDRLAAGLAAQGPSKEARVTPQCPRVVLFEVCSVLDVSADAVAKFEEAPWGR